MIQVVNYYGGEQTVARPPPVSPYEQAYYPGAYPPAPMLYGLGDDDFGYDWPFGYGFGVFVNNPLIFDHHRRGAFRHHVEAHGMGAGRAIAMGHGGRR